MKNFLTSEKIQSLLSNKKLLLIIGASLGALALLMLLLVMSIRINHNRNEMQSASQKSNRMIVPHAVKPEEMFLPREPQIIPEVILDREPKSSWTDEDAEQFWNDPLDGNSDVWKNRIFEAVDDMLENVP